MLVPCGGEVAVELVECGRLLGFGLVILSHGLALPFMLSDLEVVMVKRSNDAYRLPVIP